MSSINLTIEIRPFIAFKYNSFFYQKLHIIIEGENVFCTVHDCVYYVPEIEAVIVIYFPCALTIICSGMWTNHKILSKKENEDAQIALPYKLHYRESPLLLYVPFTKALLCIIPQLKSI